MVFVMVKKSLRAFYWQRRKIRGTGRRPEQSGAVSLFLNRKIIYKSSIPVSMHEVL